MKDHPELANQVRLLDRETKRMNRAMDELLDFAKPAGLVLAPTTIGAIVTDAVDAFRAGYDPDGKVPIAVHVPDEVAAIALHADAARLQQVVVNLVANAHRHAVGMTRVRIAATQDDEGVALIVDDDGGGIPEADLARVFEPFFTTGGTGLGLALARRVVTDHGGTIDVASGPSGTSFTVRLPRGVHGT